jgi:hypothetical protein
VEQVAQVNERRRYRKYGDEEAATYLLGSADKKDLISSPFVLYLEYGKGKDGYWSYNHKVLQLEYCTNVFKALYPQFDIVYELDHSSGQDKEKADGLTTAPLMLGWEHGGKQRSMRASQLGVNNTGTVQHGRCINLGEIQHMNFQIDNLPPVLKPLCPKLSTPTGKTITRELNVADLKAHLETEKLNLDWKRQVLFERCIKAGLPVKLTLPVMTPGYVGEPKGAAHIAFERGFLDAMLKLPNGKKVSFAGVTLQEAEAVELIVASPTIDLRKKKKPKVKREKKDKRPRNLEADHSLNLLLKNIWGPSSASHPSVIPQLLDKILNMPGDFRSFVSAAVSMMLSVLTWKKM